MQGDAPAGEILGWLTREMYERNARSVPLDDAYTDETVGAYVRNISIDSPFQQLVNRGVLSLIHLEGELQIFFTQEGFYHYLLARHLHALSKDMGIVALTRDVLRKRSSGFEEGFAGLMEIHVRTGDTDTLTLVIDECPDLVKPAAIGLILDIEVNGIGVLDKLLEHPTENDIHALIEAFKTLDHRSRLQLLKQLSAYLLGKIVPRNLSEFLLCAKCLKYAPKASLFQLYDIFLETFGPDGPGMDRRHARDWLKVYELLAIEFLRYSEKMTANQLYGKAYAIASAHRDMPVEVYRFQGLVGQLKKSLGNPSEARLDYAEAIQGLLKLGMDTMAARNMLRLSEVHKHAAEFEEALEWAVRAQGIMESHYGSSSTENAQAMGYLGSIHLEMENWAQAEEAIRKSMHVRMRLLGAESTKTCISYVNYASVLTKLGDFDNAMSLLNKAYDIRVVSFGTDHQDVATTLYARGELRLAMGDSDGAMEDHLRALDIRMKRLGANNNFTLRSRLAILRMQLAAGLPHSAATAPESLREDLQSLGSEAQAMVSELDALLGRENG
jgi:tetratricopeptide (TPR) repeat protein